MATYTTAAGKRATYKEASSTNNTYVINDDTKGATIAGAVNGDIIAIEGFATDFTASVSGRVITLKSTVDTGIVIKVQLANVTGATASFRFLDGDLTATKGAKITLGTQTLTSKAAAIAETNTLGSNDSSATFDESSGGSSSTGSTFTLTTDSQSTTGTSGNDIFNALEDLSLGNGDDVVGGEGTDTLNVRLTANAQTINASISGVEVIKVRADAGADTEDVTINVDEYSGLSEVWADRVDHESGADAAADEVLTFSNVAQGVKSVIYKGDGNSDVTFAYVDQAGTGDSATLQLKEADVGTVTIAGMETVAITTDSDDSTVDSLVLADTETLTIAASKDAVITALDLANTDDTAITITGAGAVEIDVDDANTITGSASTGNITLNAVGAGAGDWVVTTGSGADTLVLTTFANIQGSDDSINLGNGTDTVQTTANVTDGDLDRISGYEVVAADVTAGNISVDMDALAAGVNLTAIEGDAGEGDGLTVTNFRSGTSVTVTADTDQVSLTADADAEATATLVLDLDTEANTTGVDMSDTDAGDGVSTSDVKTLNIQSKNTSGLLAATASNSLAVSTTNNSLETINVSGAAALALTVNETTSITAINASTATGDLVVDVQALATDLSVTLGSGDDELTVDAADVSNEDSFVGGAGEDTLNVDLAAADAAEDFKVSGFEIINIDADAAAGNASIDVGDITSFDDMIVALGDGEETGVFQGTLSVTNIAAGKTLEISGSVDATTTGGITATFGGTAANILFSGDFDGTGTTTTLTANEDTVSITVNDGQDDDDTTRIDTFVGATVDTMSINVSSGDNFVINAAGTTTSLDTVTVTGSGNVTLGSSTTTFARAANASITLGSGDDSLQMNVVDHRTNVINAGSGTDTLVLTGAAGGTVVVDLSSSTDQITSIGLNANAAAQKGFENVNASAMTGNALDLTGSDGDNSITGSDQADTMAGGDGDDTITGGAGADNLTGDDGDDTFVLATSAANADTITDFTSTSDVLDLSAALTAATLTIGARLNAAGGANQAAGALVISTAANTDAEVYYINNTAGSTGVQTIAQIETAIAAGTNATGQVTILVDNGTSTFVYFDAAAQTDAEAGAGMILVATLVGVTGATALATGDLISV